jgi:hypothetical protein
MSERSERINVTAQFTPRSGDMGTCTPPKAAAT